MKNNEMSKVWFNTYYVKMGNEETNKIIFVLIAVVSSLITTQ
ncbi:hypothetical protein Pse7429DRAFT_2527, partial [Pseudanabaena biceps PCC 7429]